MGLGLTAFAFPAVALTGLTRDLLARRRRRADGTLEEPPEAGAPADPTTAAHAAPVVLEPVPVPAPTSTPTPTHHD
ncbi:hypothetical protein WKI68_18640 [Streptomyces sp. MS1.HAVA.3]|uniref:Uncharacterized protein n=1 Tax=Streptomyces caledonius TaxID=3134107 RepID=A0ABU8U5A3_9ACTN